MKNMVSNLYTTAATLDASKVRIVVFVLSLAMFVIAAGAPEAAGGTIR